MRLSLFTKLPVAGQVKTRLSPEIGEMEAARLASSMIDWSVSKALDHWPGEVDLHVWPEPGVQELSGRFSVPVLPQAAGDLGEKMAMILAKAQDEGRAAAIMGCDVPHISSGVLAHAWHGMSMGRNMVGPATDGGFYFIGLNRFNRKLFEDIDWGHSNVLEELLENARRIGMHISCELSRMQDIDTYQDLCAAARVFPPLKEFVLPPGENPVE